MSDIRVKAIKPLPAALPAGERVLWQDSPLWQGYARRVFHVGKLALYFFAIVVWVAIASYLNGGGLVAVARSLSWALPLASAVVLMIGFIGWLYARTTVYTITNKRVIFQSGLAFPTAVNLPFSKIGSADMKTFNDGTGDIELSMLGPRLLYSMVWPNARLLKLKRPVPVMWALPQPQFVAQVLGEALKADQQSALPPQEDIETEDQDEKRAVAH